MVLIVGDFQDSIKHVIMMR